MRGSHAFDHDPYLKAFDTRILRVDQEEGIPFAVLEDTILYPEGGGQPADRGFLGPVQVLDVQKREGEIGHFVAAPVEPGAVRISLDWARRFDHMQQHTGQHLLTAVAQDRFGWATTAFHLGESRCDIELDVAAIPPEAADQLEEAVAEEIRASRAVTSRHVRAEDYSSLKVRSRGLPEGHQGDVRLVEIQGLDLNTCGGTHLRATAELETLKLLGTEPIRGGTRLFFLAGSRVRHRLGEHERRNAGLRTLLGAPDGELILSLEAKLGQILASERRGRHLEEQLLDALVSVWAADPDLVQDHHLEGHSAAFLGQLARALISVAPTKRVFLTAELDGQAAFVVAAAPESGVDLVALGAAIAGLLEGRGGGRSPIYQGKAGSLKARDRAAEALRNA